MYAVNRYNYFRRKPDQEADGENMQRLIQITQEQFNIKLSSSQLSAFEIYAQELARWNAHTNLTAITDEDS